MLFSVNLLPSKPCLVSNFREYIVAFDRDSETDVIRTWRPSLLLSLKFTNFLPCPKSSPKHWKYSLIRFTGQKSEPCRAGMTDEELSLNWSFLLCSKTMCMWSPRSLKSCVVSRLISSNPAECAIYHHCLKNRPEVKHIDF